MQKLIHQAKAYYFGDSKLKNDYTAASITKLANESESDYYNVYMNGKATLKDVQDALTRLQKAIAGLVKKDSKPGSGDDQKDGGQAAKNSLKQAKDDLARVIDAAKKVDTSSAAKDADQKAIKDALDKAESISKDNSAKTAEVQKDAQNLAKALLQKTVDELKNKDLAHYTDTSASAFKQALKAAQAKLNDANAKVADLEAALSALKSANEGLAVKTASPTEPAQSHQSKPDDNDGSSTSTNDSAASNSSANENVEPHAQNAAKAKNKKVKIRLIHNAFVYNKRGRIVRKRGKRLLLKKRRQHTILAWNNAKVAKIKGKRYYQIGTNQFVKIANTALNDKVGHFIRKKLRAKIVAAKGKPVSVVTIYNYKGNKKGRVRVGRIKKLDGYRNNFWTATSVKGQRAYELAGSHEYVLAENLKFLK